jgi:hypothetical protein
MPINQTIYPPERLVVGVATGTLTLGEIAKFMEGVIGARATHYRKLIDVTRCTPGFGKEEVAAFAQILSTARKDRQRGPLAIVADSKRGGLAHLFTTLAGDGLSIKTFRSIHDARAWLSLNSVRDD